MRTVLLILLRAFMVFFIVLVVGKIVERVWP